MYFGPYPGKLFLLLQKITKISLLRLFLTSEMNFMSIGHDLEILDK